MPGEKKFTRLAGSLSSIFKTRMLTYQSKANFKEKILFGRITHLLDPEIT